VQNTDNHVHHHVHGRAVPEDGHGHGSSRLRLGGRVRGDERVLTAKQAAAHWPRELKASSRSSSLGLDADAFCSLRS
jgi:hypothetical protein